MPAKKLILQLACDRDAFGQGRQRTGTGLPRNHQGKCTLMVVALEVGGRWNAETAQFICLLAKAEADPDHDKFCS